MKIIKKLVCGVGFAAVALGAASAWAAVTLPAGYTEVEYIQGNGTDARIVTDYTPAPNTDKMEAVVEWPSGLQNANHAIWCARGSDSQVNSWTLFATKDNTKFRYDYMPSGHAVSLVPDFTIATGTKYTITAEDNKVTYAANLAKLQTQSTPAYSFTADSVLALFTSHYNGINANVSNYGKHRLYSLKVWRNGEIFHYFVPCKDPSGNATMVDICDNPATLTRSGTFTAGEEGHYYDDSLFSRMTVTLSTGAVELNPSAQTLPAVTVTDAQTGALLSEGTDYTVSYANTTWVGTAWAIATGAGTYAGEVAKAAFLIVSDKVLPPGYQKLESITSTGTQYIKTGMLPGTTTTVEMDFNTGPYANDTTFFGQSWAGSNYLFVKQGNQYRFFGSGGKVGDLNNNADCHLTINDDNKLILDFGNYAVTSSVSRASSSSAFNLFAGYNGGHKGSWTLYSMQIKKDGVMVRDYVPARRESDGAVGLYDRATDVFYTNQGSGEFVAGRRADLLLQIAPIAPVVHVAGSPARPEPVVTDLFTGATLVKGTDYDVSYTNNAAPGVATVIAIGKAGTAYEGVIAERDFTIYPIYHVTAYSLVTEGDGYSWSSPMSLTNALTVAATNALFKSEIWLASGTYTIAAAKTFAFSATPVSIRGGFAGTESSADERAAGTISTLDGNVNQVCLEFSNVAIVPVVIDRIRAFNGKRGIVKTGAGDVTVVNSEIIGNKALAGGLSGTGGSFTGAAGASLVVSNCVVSGNGSGPTLVTNLGYGQGLYAKTFGSVVIEDTLFLTNGIAWLGADYWNEGRDGQAGAAIYLSDAPATIRRCRFSANRGSGYSNRGSIVRVAGASGGTLFDHCRFFGNEEDYHNFAPGSAASMSGGNYGGQIVLDLANATDVVTVQNCTIAYNFSVNVVSGVGITVNKGKVVVRNSIIANNVSNPKSTGGLDIALLTSSSYADVAYSMLGGSDDAHVTANLDDNLVLGNGMIYGDPLFVSTPEDFAALVIGIGGSKVNFQLDKSKLAEVLALNVHLLSPEGYFDDDGTEHVSSGELSPAIDGGDPVAAVGAEPQPNGGVVNAGAYGGTAQASKTAEGVPAVDGAVTVTFDGEYSQPTVHFTVGGTGAFYAQAQVYVSTNNVDWVLMDTLAGIAKGTTVDALIMAYYAPGSVWAKVMLTAGGQEASATSEATPVTRPLPPWTGKGGPANVLHVRPGAIGAGTGDNWSDAVPSLRSAFALVSAAKNEIWIAGTNVLKAGSATLSASSALTVRGGFYGWENSAAERADGFYTVIDGDDVTDCLTIDNSAAVSLERILFIRSLNCGLIKTGNGDMTVSDCLFYTNGLGRSSSSTGKGARVSGKAGTTLVTFRDCVFRGNRCPTGVTSYGTTAWGAGVNAGKLKALRLENCYFVHNGIPRRSPGGGNSGEPASGNSYGSAVYSTTPVSAVGCRFVANFGNVRYSASQSAGYGGVVRLHNGADGSAFTNCAWVANGDQVVWNGTTTDGNNAAGSLTVLFDSNSGTVDVQNCTFAYNLADAYEVTAGINLIRGTVNLRDSVFYGNIIGGFSSSRGADLSLRNDSICNVSYTLFSEDSTNSITCAATATTNFLGGVIYGDPLFVTENATMKSLVKESSTTASGHKLIFWDWSSDDIYGKLEAADVHLRGGLGYHDEATGSLVTTYSRGAKSPCIDKGNPDSEYHREPAGYNGRRVNMGYYGNSPWATMSQPAGSVYYLR